MGPRRWSRGRAPPAGAAASSVIVLQWGHGDGAVEEVDDLVFTTADAWLQWGHGDGAVEERRPVTATTSSSTASMGPRRWSRGRGPLRCPCPGSSRRFNGATAMEPWKSSWVQTVFVTVTCFNGATAMEPWKRWLDRSEIRSIQGFNGATAMEPWKRREPTSGALTAYYASMGPRRWSRGRALGHLHAEHDLDVGFNGATAMEPWKSLILQ